LIVGKSRGNSNGNEYYANARAIITPRTDGFIAKNVQIYNFDSNMTLLNSCSFCYHGKVWVTGGKNTKFQNIMVDSSASSAKRIFWENWRREIFWDTDGSLTGSRSYLVPTKPHLSNIPGCTAAYGNTIIC
jgi:hypothetical protein